MSEPNDHTPQDEFASLSEWIKFAVLLVIIIATLLVIALVKPIIFDQMIPSILGDGRPGSTVIEQSPPPPPPDPPANTETADPDPAPADEEAPEPANPVVEESEDMTAGENENAASESTAETETGTDETAAGEAETAGDPAAEQTNTDSESAADGESTALADENSHVVVAGDTLYEIANRYDVTVEDLLSANPEIEDLNSIRVGQTLNVPSP